MIMQQNTLSVSRLSNFKPTNHSPWFLLWGVFLFGGFIFGEYDSEAMHRMPTWARLASSIMLIAAALALTFKHKDSAFLRFSRLIAAGMVLGCLGDFFMARQFSVSNHVIFGMASFGLGHMFYIWAALHVGGKLSLGGQKTRLVVWAVWLLIGVLGWYFVVFRGQQASFLHWAALPYSLLLATTAGVATGLAMLNEKFIVFALGATFFLLSDLILAAELFTGARFHMMGDVIWLLYGPGQMLIVYTCVTIGSIDKKS